MTTATIETAAAVKFEVGKTYSCRSTCDWDCIFSYTVVKRTAKRMTIESHGRTSVRGISTYNNVEHCKPEGDYSMCPFIYADRVLA